MARPREEDHVIVLGANLTFDRTLQVERLVPGHVIRPRTAVVTAGGKSVNVCRASRAFGVRPRLVANLPGRAGSVVGDLLDAEGHDVLRVRTAGEIRTATVILEESGRTTVLNEPGPELTFVNRKSLLDALARHCAGERVLVASGSLPPGPAAADLYDEVSRVGQARGLRVILDAARGDLAAALPSGPDVVTPNLAEALAVLSGAPVSEAVELDAPGLHEAALQAAVSLRAAGAHAALVTIGRHGVAGADAEGLFWVPAPKVHEVNAIGAGDAFVAGLACGLETGLSLREATAQAVASGAASVSTELAGRVDETVLARLLGEERPAWEPAEPADVSALPASPPMSAALRSPGTTARQGGPR
jgi:1-phosphofructokinase family hexose kinase